MPPPTSYRSIVKTIAATAAITLVIAGVAFLFFQRIAKHRKKTKTNSSFRREEATLTHEDFNKFKGKIVFNPSYEEEEDEEKRVDVLRKPKPREALSLHEPSDLYGYKKKAEPVQQNPTPPPPFSAKLLEQTPPPPPATPTEKVPAPPPPPPPPPKPPLARPPPPPPPPIPVKRNPTTLPPPKGLNSISLLKPPPAPRRNADKRKEGAAAAENSKRTVVGQKKLKPLHWDKVLTNVDHSMVWNEIKDGSLRFDDEMIENLFGYTTTNRRTPGSTNMSISSSSSNPAMTAQIFILEPRKSQNTAIVLRSLAISRKEIIEALLEGQGLTSDILEKLTKISPSQEESAKILQFNGNPTKLADAESFLFHILKAVPSAFIRINAMLFRSNYDSEILHLKESLQALELGCKELRTRGLFLKLLEAILKAGNKMNAGTSRGDAQGFNLTALRKLSDVKSTDGKTTLLHFVVEQVIRSEGRRCVISRNHSLGRSNTLRSKNRDLNSDGLTAEDKDKEYLKLGLPAVGSLRLVTRCATGEKGGFLREMKGFLEECEEELKVVREEQIRVMELVKRTTEYYQAGGAKDRWAHPIQLFGIVKDFLDMVDRVCTDITQNLPKEECDECSIIDVTITFTSSKNSSDIPKFP
ncbi:hypothetical protein Patl1_17950 [Pistacia atlantica]|uniref:Uncharacterized protein n=1 Tax=Pistacia atlantica TaxID=434234 RepID=A0ACC1BYJ1_9ROSI|nr:hypothetical protein Patl1_17950 [Pistacia atlantica]